MDDCFHAGIARARIGDMIHVYPIVRIDRYWEVEPHPGIFDRVLHNIYEFSFRVVHVFPHEEYSGCFHYLIETAQGMVMYHNNPGRRQYESYVKAGREYRGYGRLFACCDSFSEGSTVGRRVMDRIRATCKLESIQVNRLLVDYLDNYCPWEEEEAYTPEDALRRLCYFEGLDAFKESTEQYRVSERNATMEEREEYRYALLWGVRMMPDPPNREKETQG